MGKKNSLGYFYKSFWDLCASHLESSEAARGTEEPGGTLSCCIVLQWPSTAWNTLALHGRLQLCQEGNGIIHYTAFYSVALHRVLWFSTACHCSLQQNNLSINHFWLYHAKQVCRASRFLVRLCKHQAAVARLLKVCDVVISWISQLQSFWLSAVSHCFAAASHYLHLFRRSRTAKLVPSPSTQRAITD